ncbi:MAG: flagellar assembly protein FliW [Deltaproteobacteria bacterium]|nr:flagellar assembly protein FliW [Deltaproteobacteria bacterium]
MKINTLKKQTEQPKETITVESRRFGKLRLPGDSQLQMARPLLGFPGLTEFALFKEDTQAPLFWLQSLQDPGVAFLLLDPTSVLGYVIDRKELEGVDLELDSPKDALVLTTVTLRNPWKESTTNLRAPLLINTRTRRAAQLVLQDDAYNTKEPIFSEIKARGGRT